MKLNKQENEFVVDGLVHLIAQAERQLGKYEKLLDETLRDHVCDHQVRKLKILQTLKAKFNEIY